MAEDNKSNELGATIFAVVMGILLLALTLWVTQLGGCNAQDDETVSPLPVTAAEPQDQETESQEDPEADAALQAELDAARTSIDEEAARRAELATSLNDQKNANLKLNGELEGLQDKINNLEAEQGKLREELDQMKDSLKSAQSELENRSSKLAATTQDRDQIKNKLAALQNQLSAGTSDWANKLKVANQQKDETAGKLAKALTDVNKWKTAAAELDGVKTRRDQLQGRVRELEQSLNKLGQEKNQFAANMQAKDKKMVDERIAANQKKDRAIADLEKQSASLQEQVKQLKQKNANDSRNMAANVDKQLLALKQESELLKKALTTKEQSAKQEKDKLEDEVKKLKIALAAISERKGAMPADKPAQLALNLPLLVNDPAQLRDEFRPLFSQLQGIADTPEARAQAYDKLSQDGNAQPMARILFGPGNAWPAGAEAQKLGDLVKKTNSEDKYLVVGYASNDGNPAANRELSSKRASITAQKIANDSGISQDQIQAVYFGETKRFHGSQNAPNRTVEVWKVK